jgi:hypothetical protein
VLFITVDGVPSVAQWVMIGSGKIETQAKTDAVALPSSTISDKVSSSNSGTDQGNNSNNNNGKSAAWSTVYAGPSTLVVGALAAFVVLFA